MVREAKFRMSLIKSGQFFAESSVSESKYTFTLVYLSLPTTNCWRYFEIPGCRTLPWKNELTPIWSGEQRRRGKCLLGEEEAVGGEKRQGLEGVVASRSSDTRPSCDVPYCSSVSVFKLIKDRQWRPNYVKNVTSSNENSNPALHILPHSCFFLPEWG